MTDTLLVLVHGWGFDREFWRPLQTSLAATLPDVATLALDLGYFGRPCQRELPDSLSNRTRHIVVAHSLGLLRLLAKPQPAANGMGGRAGLAGRADVTDTAGLTGLVSLAGFPRFTRTTGFPQGVHPRLVRAMLARLDTEPEMLLRDFRLACGLGETEGLPAGRPDSARLAEGLAWLLDLDGRPGLDRMLGPSDGPEVDGQPEQHGLAATEQAQDHQPGRATILALAAGDDRIVPEPMSRAAFGAHPSVRLEIRPDGGHALPWTRPDWCAERIAAWLATPETVEPTGPMKTARTLGCGASPGSEGPVESEGAVGIGGHGKSEESPALTGTAGIS